MESLIKQFVTVCDGKGDGKGFGYGHGYGNGGGYGDGYGNGCGYGYGNGNGYGYGYGYGDGNGNGYGYGDGHGDGHGCGGGNGCGYGDGYGNGNGHGHGYGLCGTSLNGKPIHCIDAVPTIIESVHGNIARGYVVGQDWSLKPCFVARVDNFFAHGDTAHDAVRDATNKALRNEPVERRIERFKAAYPDFDQPIAAKELFDWHNILTGSCLFGRQQFCKEHGIDIDNDQFTVREFVELTKNAYGRKIINLIINGSN